MAKRTQRERTAPAPPRGDVLTADEIGSVGTHFVVFRVGGERFAFHLGQVAEIIRMPNVARMPLAPRSLLGLANLHGVVVPIVDTRRLLQVSEAPLDEATRIIMIDAGAPVGFVVDRVDNLAAIASHRVEQARAGAGNINPDFVAGIVKGAEGESTIKILNPQHLLRDEFSQLGVSRQRPTSGQMVSTADASRIASAQERNLSLLSFQLGEQEYALPLDRVREIIQLPQNISEVARSETAVLGVVTLRDQLLPLVSLRALLGMPPESGRKDPGKVVVLPMGGGAVGVVTDRTREILHVSLETIDPAPALLTRGEGDAEITSICRLDQGRRLVALLSPDNLFRSDLVRRVLSEQNPASDVSQSQMDGNGMADEQFIIFRLGDQEYGIAIATVDEIARLPEQIVRLPKAPAFIDGVINMRGVVVPIVDLRRRFDIASLEAATSRRILMLSIEGEKTGFIVDGVSEVMKIPADAISPTPEISTEQMRLVGRVANLDSHNRMILLVDAAQLLDRIEADVLAKFDRSFDTGAEAS